VCKWDTGPLGGVTGGTTFVGGLGIGKGLFCTDGDEAIVAVVTRV